MTLEALRAGSLRCFSTPPNAVEGRGGVARRLYSSVQCGDLVGVRIRPVHLPSWTTECACPPGARPNLVARWALR